MVREKKIRIMHCFPHDIFLNIETNNVKTIRTEGCEFVRKIAIVSSILYWTVLCTDMEKSLNNCLPVSLET